MLWRFIPACAGNTPAPVYERARGHGSSPRVRGTHEASEHRQRRRRFIPACAGNTDADSVLPVPFFGSSPRVRGTPVAPRLKALHGRFIPACAGNTVRSPTEQPWPPVHPRVCGEHRLTALLAPCCDGSSPRVRGTRLFEAVVRWSTTVHPRVCGEHMCEIPVPQDVVGSSPRVRGTLSVRRVGDVARRFIPACAGNTIRSSVGGGGSPVHPRVCGEHMYPVPCASWHAGSSPRVRGTPIGRLYEGDEFRFIPACAGNTRWCRAASDAAPVHPRVCGEHQWW